MIRELINIDPSKRNTKIAEKLNNKNISLTDRGVVFKNLVYQS